MSCVKPIEAYWIGPARDRITFDRAKSATKVGFKLPCGRCIGCRLQRANQWGLRCLHEAKMWPHNSFVTLTYSDEFLPEGGTLVLRDLQLFMKRLRKARRSSKSNPLRFFAGGEYGEQNRRPHYHLLLFNCGFSDMRQHSVNMRGEPVFTSEELSVYWPYGFSSIGAVTFESAVYVAKYALKKLNISDASSEADKERYAARYVVYDEDGICYDRVPEFAVMSRRPGIGRMYYEKYGQEVRDHDNVILDGRPVRPPRYYDTISECVDEPLYDVNKKKRKRLEVLNRADNTPERLRVKEKLMSIAADKKERNL